MKIEFFQWRSGIVDNCSTKPYYNRDQNFSNRNFRNFLGFKKKTEGKRFPERGEHLATDA